MTHQPDDPTYWAVRDAGVKATAALVQLERAGITVEG